jgi:hypothetical protein
MLKEQLKNKKSDFFPEDTRIWIYQCSTILSQNQINIIESLADDFVNDWTAHGTKLKAAIEVYHQLFIVVFADEKQALASGCSIDKSLKFIQSLESDLGITLLDRMQVAYMEKDEFKIIHLNKLAEKIKEKILDGNTKIFNNLIKTKADLQTNWFVAIKDSWHKSIL